MELTFTFGFIAVLAGACLSLVLLAVNVFIAARRGTESYPVTLALHVVGVMTVIGNLIRIHENATNTMVVGNAVALLCICASMRRCIAANRSKR